LPSQPWTQHRDAIADRVTGEPVIDAVLNEGDALYLPRGWIHSAQALDRTSIHLTVGISPLTVLDVARAVVDELATLDTFRKSLPMGGDPTDRDEIIATVTKVTAEIVGTLRDEASALGDGAATKLVQRHADRTRPVAVRPLASLAAGEDAGTIRVRWRRGLVSAIEQSGELIVLRLPDKVMSFPASCAEAVTALRRGDAADADSLPGLDQADGTVLIRRLLREAVVVPVDE
jgi:hypothetical protein